jgi:biotin carboxyl carrier protein
MIMPFQHIQQIYEYLADTDIALLELRGPQGSVRLENNEGKPPAQRLSPLEIIVTSPGTGLFLHRHPSSQNSLVNEGDVVVAGQIIGLLQVGVLLLPVQARSAGAVIGHLVAHGDLVDFGRKLIALRSQTEAVPA